jgi:hypothetical protein
VYRGHLSLPLFLFNLSPSKISDERERERGCNRRKRARSRSIAAHRGSRHQKGGSSHKDAQKAQKERFPFCAFCAFFAAIKIFAARDELKGLSDIAAAATKGPRSGSFSFS